MMVKAISVLICLFIGVVYTYADLADGLISAWTFDDGTARDSVGNNDGEIKGGVDVTDGKFGKAFSFNGKDGFIQIPHDKSLEALADGLTVSAWIYVKQFVDHAAVIFKGEKIGWTNNYVFRIATLGSPGSLTWGVCVPGTEGWFHTEGAIEPNKWFFVCLTADGKQAVGHVAGEDGKVKIPASGQGNPHPIVAPYRTCPDFPIEIGVGRAVGGTVGNDNYYNGIIDEIYLWNRALSEDEIAQLAKGARPKGVFPVEPSGKLATLWGFIKR